MLKTGTIFRAAACLIILVGFEMGLGSSRAQLQLGARATVTLQVVDSYGRPLEYKVETCFAKDQPNVNLATQFEGLAFHHAVQGKIYEFRLVPVRPSVEYPAFKQLIAVGEASTLAVFSVPKPVLIADMGTPWPATKFAIRPAPKTKDVWVNVRPAFGPDISGTDTSETSAIDMDGSFKLHGTHGGLYVVTVYQANRIRKLAIVDIPQFAPPEPIEVKLD